MKLVTCDKQFLETNLKDGKQRSLIQALLTDDSMSCWGMAPNKTHCKLEQLGLGILKMQSTGFASMVLINTDKCVSVFTAHPHLCNNKQPPLTLKVLQESVQADGYQWKRPCGPTHVSTCGEASEDERVFAARG